MEPLAFLSFDYSEIFVAFLIILLTLVIARVISRFLDRFIKQSSRIIRVNSTQYNFLKHFSVAGIYLIGIILAIYNITYLRTLSISLLAGAGILAIAIGFASQQAFANIISGIFLVIFKPFSVGDRIKINSDVAGVVEDLTLRHTIIRTFENKMIIIPNAIISNETIENASFGNQKICKFVEFSIGYDSDIDKAMKIIREEAEKHPSCIDNRNQDEIKKNEPKVAVRLISFGDSSVNLRAWVWAKDPSSAFKMGCDLNKSIKERFDNSGIEIPYPYRTIVYKSGPKKKYKTS